MNNIGICNNQAGKQILSTLPLPLNRDNIIFEVATRYIVWKNYHFIPMIEVSWIRRHLFTSTSGGFIIFHLNISGWKLNDIMLQLVESWSFLDVLGFLSRRKILPMLLLLHDGHGCGSCEEIQGKMSLGLQVGFPSTYFVICIRRHVFSLISIGFDVSHVSVINLR